jgi:NAD-dependent dihydropyrimidine dehydrogenase PreA subunit
MKKFHVKWLPLVNVSRCTGCNRCVLACGPDSLELQHGVVVLVRPETCGSEGHCISACRESAIQMGWVEMQGDRTRGKWGSGGRVWPRRVRGGHA